MTPNYYYTFVIDIKGHKIIFEGVRVGVCVCGGGGQLLYSLQLDNNCCLNNATSHSLQTELFITAP